MVGHFASAAEPDRRSYKTVILEALSDDVVSGKLMPGEKLSEIRLAERFGVSRMPVREALIELRRRGMVRVIPQVGTYVTEITTDLVLSQFEVREALEVEAARLSAARSSNADKKRLQDLMEQMSVEAAKGSTKMYIALDANFHAAIFESTGNPTLVEHYESLMGNLKREYLSLLVSSKEGRTSRSLAEHAAVLDAIVQGDSDLAGERMRTHVVTGRIELQEAMELRGKRQKTTAGQEH